MMDVSNQTHVLWDRPQMQPFWKNVKDVLERILKVNIPK